MKSIFLSKLDSKDSMHFHDSILNLKPIKGFGSVLPQHFILKLLVHKSLSHVKVKEVILFPISVLESINVSCLLLVEIGLF